MQRTCTECGEEFNTNSPEKKRAGGLITHCADCSEEHAVRALGFASGDGKMAAVSIVKCATHEDAQVLKQYWRKAAGMDKGKSCQMHTPSLTMPKVKFSTVTASTATNHKGKM